MHILIGYGHDPITTGNYFEAALTGLHRVTFVGSSGTERPGYPPTVDLLAVLDTLPEPPDLFLYIDSGNRPYLPANLHRLPCPTAAYLIDVHVGGRLRLPLAEWFDYVFIAQKKESVHYRRFADQYVGWLPLACDPNTATAAAESLNRPLDIGFIGHVPAGSERERLLIRLAANHSINDFRRGYHPSEIGQLYGRSRIAFNHAILNDMNMRVFEGMAAGALLLTPRIDNGLTDLFQEGVHLVLYAGEDDLIAKANYYLTHELERERIASRGQAEVLQRHTYDMRCQEILDTIFYRQPGARSPLRGAGDRDTLVRYARLTSMLRLVDPTLAISRRPGLGLAARLSVLFQGSLAILRKLRYG